MPWFPKKYHDPLIAGIRLTRDRATFLLTLCDNLAKSLHKQRAYIQAFCTEKKGPSSISILKSIQERHSRITSHLASLILHVTTSTEPWLKELGDAQAALQRKVVVCNNESSYDKLGRDKAARRYWPLISETYDAVDVLVSSLEQELSDAVADDAVWTEDARKKLVRHGSVKSTKTRTQKASFDGKNVRFRGIVEGRVYGRDDAPSLETERKAAGKASTLRRSNEFEVRLTDDRKFTSNKLHEQVLERRQSEEAAMGSIGRGEQIGRPYEDGIVEARWRVPL